MPESPEKLDLRSMDVAADKRRLLQQLFPEVFTESTDAAGTPAEIDFEKLKAVLGEHATLADPAAERYGLDWPGKRDALKAVQTPALGTLVPCPEESVDWDTTKNVFIEGDNLEVLKLLQKSYYGKVKMIYIDPPYNTGNDFVYPDNYAESLDTYLRFTGQISGEGIKLTTNSKDSGRFHSNWLRMMYPRLYVGKNLLREDGVIFISIDDGEVRNLRSIADEILDPENFIANIIWEKKYTRANDAIFFSDNHDHILCYCRSKDHAVIQQLPRNEKQLSAYSNPDNHPKGAWKATPLHAKSGSNTAPYQCKNGVTWSPPKGTYRRFNDSSMKAMDEGNEVWFGKDNSQTPSRKSFLSEVKGGVTPVTIWPYSEVGHNHEANNQLKELGLGGLFNNPKPFNLIIRQLYLSNDKDSIVLDFFSGSATTAQAVMQLNAEDGGKRRHILVQLPEPCDETTEAAKSGFKKIAEIAKERIRRAGSKIRAEWEAKHGSREDAKTRRNEESRVEDLFSQSKTLRAFAPSRETPSTISPPDLGFRVFKLAPSNFKRWDGEAAAESVDALEQQLEANLDHLAGEATEESILFEILLKAGFELTCPVEKLELAGLPVFSVEDGALLLCLADRITPALIDAVAARQPIQFICLDRALHGGDALKVNALETFRACQPEIQFRTV